MTVNNTLEGRYSVHFPLGNSLVHNPPETVEGNDLFPRVEDHIQSLSPIALTLSEAIARLSFGILETTHLEIEREGLEWRNAVYCRFTTQKIEVVAKVARTDADKFYRFFLPISSAVQLNFEKHADIHAFSPVLLSANLKKVTLSRLGNRNVLNLILDIKRTDPKWEELEIKDSDPLTSQQMLVGLESTGTLKALTVTMGGRLLPVLSRVWFSNLERLNIRELGATRLVDPKEIESCILGHPSLKSYSYIGRNNETCTIDNEIGLIPREGGLDPVKGLMEDEIERIQSSGVAVFKQVDHPFDPKNFNGMWSIMRNVNRICITGTLLH